jgi:hypothetical protein
MEEPLRSLVHEVLALAEADRQFREDAHLIRSLRRIPVETLCRVGLDLTAVGIGSAARPDGVRLVLPVGRGSGVHAGAGVGERPDHVGRLRAGRFVAFFHPVTVLALLATVVGVLVEVPVMLSVCRFCLATRDWFTEAPSVPATANQR